MSQPLALADGNVDVLITFVMYGSFTKSSTWKPPSSTPQPETINGTLPA
ncbi:hypothetical protein SAMN05216466_10512 [Paraburkholderia phenazinium]|uniref:Uncharacterized protein n=1 Tax=Paraburkholderia phenazinium TaxID=60549 RepID=A0A1G7WQU8_9BURK|nr:hypothetical protein SAMN05216466_10512 [Paraburkholderia phenazinium]